MKSSLNVLFAVFSSFCAVNCAQFKVTTQVYFDVNHDGVALGRIVLGLFGDDAPKTVKNFREICLNGIDGLSYNGTRFHRIIRRFMIQGGDILNGNGTGSTSIYGDYFEDESLTINHTIGGFLGMANQGPDTNGCQFYITTVATSWLDGKHTVFGKVTNGQDVVHKIERVKTTTDDEPVSSVILSECGEIEVDKPFYVSDNPYDIMGWVKASAIPLTMSFTILSIFQYFIRKLDNLS
ncbi:CLUMA_CG007164, isoform A [Clunio marinus]|uniref:Peptidyl-prolyl cis-trans isomerase n=1 Tax=Clunio marinus TaxID=568069 RepID=A0A1J1I1K6_9DIPT|nr:CLUMA_CG007164, isoform A [Clunio marinus]